MADVTTLGSKKRRLQGSCDHCRVRKVKCDSAQRLGNKCSNCLAFNIVCTHVAAMSRKNRTAPSCDASTIIEDLQVHINDILSDTVPYTVSKDMSIVHALLTELARYARSLETKLTEAERHVHHLKSSPAPTTLGTPESEIHLMEGPLSRLEISENKNIQFGAKNEAKFILHAKDMHMHIDPTHTSRHPEIWHPSPWHYPLEPEPSPLEFPPPDLLSSLVTLFLNTTNRHLHMMHGPTLMRQIGSGLHYTSHSFGSVVLAICAIASPFSDDPRLATEGVALGCEWYRQLKPISPSKPIVAETALWDLQLFPLMVLTSSYTLTIRDHVMLLTGMGIRVGQVLNLNRKKRKDTSSWTINDELLIRAWWALLNIDVYSSCLGGRLPITNPDEYDNDYPIEVDDEYWPGETQADPDIPWRQPPDVPSLITNWILHTKVLDICNFAQRTIYTVRRSDFWDAISTTEWNQNVAVALDSALNEWVDSIPDYFRWNPHAPTDHAAILYSTYYWVQIQVHRPFLGGKAGFSGTAICTTAARACIHVAERYHHALGLLPAPSMFSSLLHSCLVLLMNTKDGLAVPRDLDDIRTTMQIFERHEDRFKVTGRYNNVIREIYEVLQLPQAVTNDTRKRKDRQEINEWDGALVGADSYGVELGQPNNIDLWDGWNITLDGWDNFFDATWAVDFHHLT